ncbi:methylamine utilization protein [Colwellia hornerae]|uniref:Methylamine utilization protein n=1 Tax=Colwellia hornerae TaxID=89402 RepID=A0A5C6QIL8_9GAMM|nr:methylamine utilization protein [Colwellia hornerae]TWX53381.1 methylamine utilization protein [Colwellia hornerae]TWX60201.1 methylamine utilization protein [Colwellia hornerae]TWX69006.1 methylamine utilization protein [Colwellia hornerae]
MIALKFRLFMVMFFCSVVFIETAFSQVVIKVVDQNNAPLPDAVIEYVLPQTVINKSSDDRVYEMDQINKQFSPHVLVVPINSQVSFPNKDDIRHHVYSFSLAKTFELKLYAGKPKSPVRFDQKGLVVMGCNIHDAMVGYIYVSDKDNAYLSDVNGEVLLTQPLALNTQLKIWHPNSTIGLTKHTLLTVDQNMIDNNEIVIVISVNAPPPRDSFEELAFHEH